MGELYQKELGMSVTKMRKFKLQMIWGQKDQNLLRNNGLHFKN